MPGRWAQLTYTSSDAKDGVSLGGFQVKQRSEDLSDVECDLALREVPEQILPVVPLPKFPSAADYARLPRRLAFVVDSGTGVLCHSVNAGADASGRPDNVFSHFVLDRGTGAESSDVPSPAGARRPALTWGSPRWLTPHGAAAVRAADFVDSVPPTLVPGLDRRALVDFLFDESVYRLGCLGLLLDAAAAALAGGPGVAVLVDDEADGARWLGVLSLFCAPGTAQERLTFSTYERAHDLDDKSLRYRCVVVSRADLEDRPHRALFSRWTVVDLDRDPETEADERGTEAWVTAYDQRVPVTDWSRLALDLCIHGADVVVSCLGQLDTVADGASWPAGGAPAVPLALVMASDDRFELSKDTIARVVTSADLSTATFGPELLRVILPLTSAALGSTVGDAWAALETGPVVGPVRGVVFLIYLERAFADQDLWDRSWPPLLPADVDLDTGLQKQLRTLVEGSLQHLDPIPGLTEARRALHRLAFICRLSRLVPAAGLGALEDRAAAPIGPVLLGGSGGALAQGVDESLAELVAEPLGAAVADYVAELAGPPGRRLDPAVRKLLGPPARIRDLLARGLFQQDPLAAELIAGAGLDDPDDPRLRPASAAVRLGREVPWPGRTSADAVSQVLDEVGRGQPWRQNELCALVEHLGDAVDVGVVAVVGPMLFPDRSAPTMHRAARRLLDHLILFERADQAEPAAQQHGSSADPAAADGTPTNVPPSRPWARGDAIGVRPAAWLHDYLEVLAELSPRWYLENDGFPPAAATITGGASRLPGLTPQKARALAPHVITAAVAVEMATRSRGGDQVRRLLDRLDANPRSRQVSSMFFDAGSEALQLLLEVLSRTPPRAPYVPLLVRAVVYAYVEWDAQAMRTPLLTPFVTKAPAMGNEPPLMQELLSAAVELGVLDRSRLTGLLRENLSAALEAAYIDTYLASRIEAWWRITVGTPAPDPRNTLWGKALGQGR